MDLCARSPGVAGCVCERSLPSGCCCSDNLVVDPNEGLACGCTPAKELVCVALPHQTRKVVYVVLSAPPFKVACCPIAVNRVSVHGVRAMSNDSGHEWVSHGDVSVVVLSDLRCVYSDLSRQCLVSSLNSTL